MDHQDTCSLFKLNSKLRDLELEVESSDNVERIFDAFENNYVIKTVKIESKKPVLKKTQIHIAATNGRLLMVPIFL